MWQLATARRFAALLRSRTSDDSGQAAIAMALGMFLIGIPMMLAVFDGGLLLNDRRDAQNLVDRAAMAGAMELALDASDTGATAEEVAEEWVLRNGGDFGADDISIVTTNACYSASDPVVSGVTVSISRDAPTFLAGAFGLDLRSGASATACAGVPIEYFGIFPLVVAAQGLLGTCFGLDGLPIPGADCEVRVDGSENGLVGELSIAYPGDEGTVPCSDSGAGASDLEQNYIHGIQAWCAVGDEVSAKPGQNIQKTFDGIKGRLALEGSCDAAYAAEGRSLGDLQDAWGALDSYLEDYPDYEHEGLRSSDVTGPIPGLGDGIDDFYEIWATDDLTKPAGNLTPLPCPGYEGENNSPRNIVLIVVNDTFDTSGKKYTILDFVRVYLEGCTRTANNGTSEFRRDCGWNNLGSGKLTIHARYVHQVGAPASNLGLTPLMLGDREVFLLR